jgi:hypothetical protein
MLITTGCPESIVMSVGVPDSACAIVRKPYTDEDVLEAVTRCMA